MNSTSFSCSEYHYVLGSKCKKESLYFSLINNPMVHTKLKEMKWKVQFLLTYASTMILFWF